MGGVIPVQPYSMVDSNYDVHYVRRGKDDHVGAGTSGEVRPCMHLQTKEGRCVKSIEKKDWSSRRRIMDEISLLEAVSDKHPNIVKYFEYFEEWHVVNLIFEYCARGNLEQAVKTREFKWGGERLAAILIRQVVSALWFLRDLKIVHRDVKPANLVFAAEEVIKLTDFGSATYAEDQLDAAAGSPAFYAPEILQLPRGKGYSFPVDMWALGISAYMVLFEGVHPFITDNNMRKQDLRSGIFEVGWTTSRGATDLLNYLLMPNPDQRVSPSDAMDHSWFCGYGLGTGTFSKTVRHKLVLDSHGNWV